MHPLVKLSSFLLLLLSLSLLNKLILCGFAGILTVCVLLLDAPTLKRFLWRTRYLFLSILLLYAFSTPGELLPWQALGLSMSYEGLQAGVLQMCRLYIALTALVLLNATLPLPDLIAAIHSLLTPLRYLGVNTEVFSVRLMLTLHYAAHLSADKQSAFSLTQLQQFEQSLKASLEAPPDAPPEASIASSEKTQTLTIQTSALTWRDLLAFSALLAGFIWIWLK